MAVPETTESTASTAVDETNAGSPPPAPETPEVDGPRRSIVALRASGGGYKQDGKGDGGGPAAAEVDRLATAIAGLRTADSMENLASLVPADTSGPDESDRRRVRRQRLRGRGDAFPGRVVAVADGETDAARSSSSWPPPTRTTTTPTLPFAHAVRAVVSGVSDLALALTLARPRPRARRRARFARRRSSRAFRIARGNRPALVGCAVAALPELALALARSPPPTPSRNAVARRPRRRIPPRRRRRGVRRPRDGRRGDAVRVDRAAASRRGGARAVRGGKGGGGCR